MKHVINLFFISSLFCISLLPKCAHSSEYYFVDFNSNGLILNTESGLEIGGGTIADDKGEPLLLSANACKDKIKENIIQIKSFEDSFKYSGHGIYDVSSNFGRMVCIQKSDLPQNMIGADKIGFFIKFQEFIKKYSDKFPIIIDTNNFDNYTIFPLDSDQKEAKQLTEKLDKELLKIIKKSDK